MATKLWLDARGIPPINRGTNDARADGTAAGWSVLPLLTSQPTSSLVTLATPVTTGPTAGVEGRDGASNPYEFISEPLAAGVTISGTITFNLWTLENAMTANCGPQVIVERLDSQGNIASTVINSEQGVELPLAIAAANWTGTPTSTVFSRGDRLRIRILANDAGGTMTSGNVNFHLDGTTAAADGDSWVQFNEALTFESDPAGSQIFLTTTSLAAGKLEAWTARGAGSTNAVTNTVVGYTAPVQITDTAGGTVIEWWSKPLQAFTLGGKALFNVRMLESAISHAQARCEIATANGDFSSPAVWGAAGSVAGGITSSDAAYTVAVAGANVAVTNGQRLRFRVYIDDGNALSGAMVASRTVTTTYAGVSAAAAGDTYVTLPQSITEFIEAIPELVTAPQIST